MVQQFIILGGLFIAFFLVVQALLYFLIYKQEKKQAQGVKKQPKQG